MCPFEGGFYLTGIASFCKLNIKQKLNQCLQRSSSRFVSVAYYKEWIEETSKLLMEVGTVLAPLTAAVSIQKLSFWASNCHIKAT